MHVAWVYKRVEGLTEHTMEAALRLYGSEGWELAAFEPVPGHREHPPVAIFKRSRVEHERPPETEVTKLLAEVVKLADFLAKRNLDGNEEYAVAEAKTLGKLVLELVGERRS